MSNGGQTPGELHVAELVGVSPPLKTNKRKTKRREVISFSRAKGPAPDKPREPVLRAYFGDEEIHVDLFAGGGGASVGAAKATGRSPNIAINHSPVAIAMHKANHPTTRHYIEDVYEVDPREATGGSPVALLWMSPTCTFFSKAKGTKLSPEAIKIRGLAWSALPWIVHTRPRIIVLENVEEFIQWGPIHQTHSDGCSQEVMLENRLAWEALNLSRKGMTKTQTKRLRRQLRELPFDSSGCLKCCHRHQPIKSRSGETFRAFVEKIRSKGYWVDWKILKACDFGAPTTRKRVYMIMSADGQPRAWPEPSHGPGRIPYRTAAECINWDIPCPSIFDRKEPLAEKTMARIARGIQKFVIDAARPFVIPTSHGGVGRRDLRIHDVCDPMPTITAAQRGELAVVAPTIIKAKTYGGGGNDAMSADEPLRTVTASKRGEFAVATATIVRTAHGDVDASGKKRGRGSHDIELPLGTVCASGTDFALASAVLVPSTHGDKDGKPDGRTRSVDEPMQTLTTRGAQGSIVVPYMVHRSNGERPGQEPRTYDIQAPHPTVVAEGKKTALCLAMLTKHNGGNNDAHGSSGQHVTAPMDTIATHNTKAVTVAHVVRYNGERREGEQPRGSQLELPLSTLDTSNRFALATSHLMKFRGTSEAHIESCSSGVDEPVPTISASGMHVAEVRAFLLRYNGESGPQAVDEPIGTLDTNDRYALATVVIDGELYEIVDIGMRMLTPRELFAAQGFDHDYTIDPIGPNGKPLTKTEQIRAVGNSVCPPVAEAIVSACFAKVAA